MVGDMRAIASAFACRQHHFTCAESADRVSASLMRRAAHSGIRLDIVAVLLIELLSEKVQDIR